MYLPCLRFLPLLASFAALVPAPLLSAESPDRPLEVETIFQPAAVQAARISHDGRHLGAISVDKNGARSLLVLDLDSRQTDVVRIDEIADIGALHWVDDRSLVFSLGYDSQYTTGLYAARLGNLKNATRFSAYDYTKIVGLPRARPSRALVWIAFAALESDPGNRLVEINTEVNAVPPGQRLPKPAVVRTFNPPKGGVPVDWIALENGELGYCVTYLDKKETLHRYEAADGTWTPVPLDYERYRIADVDPDQRSLWVSHYEADQGYVLQRFDPVTATFAAPTWRDPTYDLSQSTLHFSRKSGQLVAVSYQQRRRFTKALAEPFASSQQLVQQKFPNANVTLLGFSDDETRLIYGVGSPQDPGRVLLLDLKQKNFEVLSEVAPWLQNRTLQATQPLSYTTGDGLRQEGYLTLPASASPAHKAPLVVLVHSGPWLRDTWSFNPTVQFLASRGYAVLQPNYRGSTGYLPAISRDERFAFRKMQEDIAAATRAVTGADMIDGSRVAIMGGGFGGYLAMSGAAFEPQLYSAAISILGVFEWSEIVREMGHYPAARADYEQLRDFLGKPGQDRDTFIDLSPLKHANTIQAPTLLVYDEDPNLWVSRQAKQLAAALKKNGGDATTFVLKSGNYDERGQASAYAMHREIEKFLVRTLQIQAKK
jgi:acetyl esterase/lipase